MNISVKKLDNGFELPEIGLGTWKIGGSREVDYSKDDEWIQSLREAIELGYRHIDTAHMYGNGHCEELVGKAIQDYKRSDFIIATKVSDANLSYDHVLRSAENSMKRLNIDDIDLFYIHCPNPNISLKETMKAMSCLVNEKLVKNIAVSNFTVDLLKEAQHYSEHKIVANQVEYSLLTREEGSYGNNKNMESLMLPYCQENDIFLVAERPLERGLLLEKRDIMDKMSEKYKKTYAQIAINWLISQKNVVTIPKSENVKHLKENLGGMGWKMHENDIEMLRESFK